MSSQECAPVTSAMYLPVPCRLYHVFLLVLGFELSSEGGWEEKKPKKNGGELIQG